jgi:hypothetical protein
MLSITQGAGEYRGATKGILLPDLVIGHRDETTPARETFGVTFRVSLAARVATIGIAWP